MPSILRSRVALFVLLGAFLIPIGMSSLRGLTHVLTCEEQVATPFTLVVPKEGPPEVLSARPPLTRGEDPGLCGGLKVDLEVRVRPGGGLEMLVPITNESDTRWRGTVELVVDGTPVPIDIGEIAAGATKSDTIRFRLGEGTHEVVGNLLIGP